MAQLLLHYLSESEVIKMNRLTITIPVKDNDKVDLPELHAKARAFLVKACGAFSSIAVHGQWEDPTDNQLYYDNSIRYEVLVAATLDILYPLTKLVKEEGKQKCVLLTSEEVNVECQ